MNVHSFYLGGTAAERLERSPLYGAEGAMQGHTRQIARGFFENSLSVYPVGNKCPAFIGTEKGKDGEDEKWPSFSVTPLPVNVGSLNSHVPDVHWLRDNLYLYL